MGQMIRLRDWVKSKKGFGYPLSAYEISCIAKNRETWPPAQKRGKSWVVDEDAEFIGIQVKPAVSPDLSDDARKLVERAIDDP